MKKLLLLAVFLVTAIFGANAQVKISSPHPDLDIKIKRCAYASGTVVIDMIITNFGREDDLNLYERDILAYDDEGNAYSNDNCSILNGLVSQGLSSNTCIALPQDIPLKFRLQLDGIFAQASKFALIKIGFWSRGIMSLDDDKPLTIRNLEWVK